MEEILLSTAQVAARLRVGVSTVKRWADSGELPHARTAGKHRRFSAKDVDDFRAKNREAELEPLLQETLDLLLGGGSIHELVGRMFFLRAQFGDWLGVAEFFGRLLEEVGRRWSLGEMDILQEHTVSERLSRAMGYVAESIPVDAGAKSALLLTVEGEEHVLGLMLAELVLREQGWACVFAGRRTPLSEVEKFVEAGLVDLVGVSASGYANDAPTLRNHYADLRALTKAGGVELVLGGWGAWPKQLDYGHRVRELPEFAALLGARGGLAAKAGATR